MFNTAGKSLIQAVTAITEGETSLIANLANTSALIYEYYENINWAGFYLLEGNELVLGPFQGKVACVRIPMGKGVCGTAAAERKTIVVDNVHEFPGHIACDAASMSEIVVPIVKNGSVVGVLDIDSPLAARFSEVCKKMFEEIVEVLVSRLV